MIGSDSRLWEECPVHKSIYMCILDTRLATAMMTSPTIRGRENESLRLFWLEFHATKNKVKLALPCLPGKVSYWLQLDC